MKNLAIIPARSGSKGLADKNIKVLNGKPMLAYTIEAAKGTKMFDEIFVSTDSEKYAKIAVELGACVPFLRSDELSTDTASSWDVVKDAIIKYKELGKEFDTVALLQPTSPLRTSDDIIKGYNEMQEKNANIIVGVCEVEHSPMWSNVLPDDNSFKDFINPNLTKQPRQSLPTYYRINGAVYIIRTKYLMCAEHIYAEGSYALIMPKEHSIDIDDKIDFTIAEAIMNKL